jgi:transcriptional regulator with XRE-family HTH domain
LVPTTAEPTALLHREDLGFHQVAALKKDGLAWFPNQVVLGLICTDPWGGATCVIYMSQGYNPAMIIGDRLRELREEKKLSQGDIEKRTGLLRCYISRVENGHPVPAIETLEKMTRALEVPLYQLFYEGEKPPKVPILLKSKSSEETAWGSKGKDARYLNKLRRLLSKAGEQDRKLLLHMAQKMAHR